MKEDLFGRESLNRKVLGSVDNILQLVKASKPLTELHKALKGESATVHLEELVGGALSLYAAAEIRRGRGVHIFVAEDRDAAAYMLNDLYALLDEERVWMNPHLTLSDLAMQVGTNRTYLSNYLNNRVRTTFYDYINGFRMEAALALLNDPDSTLTMVEVAESCGFNSISTFRRVFVRAMDCSYVEYRNRILAEKHPQGEI